MTMIKAPMDSWSVITNLFQHWDKPYRLEIVPYDKNHWWLGGNYLLGNMDWLSFEMTEESL